MKTILIFLSLSFCLSTYEDCNNLVKSTVLSEKNEFEKASFSFTEGYSDKKLSQEDFQDLLVVDCLSKYLEKGSLDPVDLNFFKNYGKVSLTEKGKFFDRIAKAMSTVANNVFF